MRPYFDLRKVTKSGVLAEIDVTADAKQSAPLRGKIVKAANADKKQVLLVSCRL